MVILSLRCWVVSGVLTQLFGLNPNGADYPLHFLLCNREFKILINPFLVYDPIPAH